MAKLFSSKKKSKRSSDKKEQMERPLEDAQKEESLPENKEKAERPAKNKAERSPKKTEKKKQQPDKSSKSDKQAKSPKKPGFLHRPLSRRQVVYGCLIIVGVFFAAAALRVLIGYFLEDATARSEYDQLRESFPTIAGQPSPSPSAPANEDEEEDEPEDDEEDEFDLRSLSLDELAALNRDFIGWINAGSFIDYPVVRGSDNSRYINTTFFGSRNTAGAIFMDYRHSRGFDEQVAILYGHYTRDGSMFSSLISFLDPGFRRSNPNINITTRDGRNLTYKVFAATLTDAWDVAYSIGINDSARASEVFPNAPGDASRFLLLSTCTRSSNDDERILVYAALA